MEFEWKIVPRFTTLGILVEIQKTTTAELKRELEQFKGRIIFVSMYNDIDWENEETKRIILRIPSILHSRIREEMVWNPYCGEEEVVRGVHTFIAGVVQVYHRLHVVEEEEKGRKVEQEVEREDQGEETAHTWMAMEMTWKTQTWATRATVHVCEDEDTTNYLSFTCSYFAQVLCRGNTSFEVWYLHTRRLQ